MTLNDVSRRRRRRNATDEADEHDFQFDDHHYDVNIPLSRSSSSNGAKYDYHDVLLMDEQHNHHHRLAPEHGPGSTVPTTPNTGDLDATVTMDVQHILGDMEEMIAIPQASPSHFDPLADADADADAVDDDCSSLNSNSTTPSIVYSGDVAAGVHDDAALEEAFRRSRHSHRAAYNASSMSGTGTGTGTGGDNHSASAVYSAIAAASAVDKPPCEVVVLIGHAQQNHIRHFRRSAAAAASSSSSGRYRKVSESSNSSDAENYNAAINAANYEGVEEHKSSEEDVWAAAGEHYNQQAMRNSGTTYTSSSFLHQNENIVRNDGERTMHKNASHRSIGSRDRSTFLRRTPSASSSRSADVSMTEQRNSVRDLVKKFDQYGKQRTMNGKFDRATSMSSYQSRSSRREKRKKSKVDGNYLDGSKVRFSDVEIREYQRVIGDNPSCSNGPPMSIGWRYNILGKMSVGDFEQTRMDANDVYGGRMKKVPVTLLTREKREQLLENFGFSRAELADAVRRNIKIKNQRRQTVHNLPVSKFEEAVEKVSRKIKKVVMPNYKNCPR